MRALFLFLVATALIAAERPVVMILDRSASMRSNDPQRYALDAVQLALATVRPSKPILFIGFDVDAEAITSWRQFTDAAGRREVRDQLGEIKFTGRGTRYVEALELARDRLEERAAAPGTRVFFLTDGNPDESSSEIRDAARRYAARGWIVEAIRINKDSGESSPDLRELAEATRGGYTEVNESERLVEHFIGLTSSENDVFDLDLRTIDDARRIEVPAGTERLTYIVAKDKAANPPGILDRLTGPAGGVDLESGNAYRYPAASKALDSRANIEIISVADPQPGTWAAGFAGVPRKVYVSLSFPVRVEPLALPADVPDGTEVLPGIAIAHGGGAQGRAMAAAARITMNLTLPDGTSLYRGPAPLSGEGATEAVFAQGVTAKLPAGVPRGRPIPVECTYTITVGAYRLTKRSGFRIDPARAAPPPAPAISARSTPAEIGPAWLDLASMGAFRLSVQGIGASGSLAFRDDNAFSFPGAVNLPAQDAAVPVRFTPATLGLHRGVARSVHGATGIAVEGPGLAAHGYRFNGPEAWTIAGPGPSPAAGWVAKDPASPDQPLQAATTTLADGEARSVNVAVSADGAVRITGLPPSRPRTLYVGTILLRYGMLPPRTMPVRFADAPPPTRLELSGAGTAIRPGAEWMPGTWAVSTHHLTLASGVPGRIEIELSDLRGPEGELLTASRDLRAVILSAAIAPGSPARFDLRLYRGRDALPGPYRGIATVIFTPESGTPERIEQPVEVIVP